MTRVTLRHCEARLDYWHRRSDPMCNRFRNLTFIVVALLLSSSSTTIALAQPFTPSSLPLTNATQPALSHNPSTSLMPSILPSMIHNKNEKQGTRNATTINPTTSHNPSTSLMPSISPSMAPSYAPSKQPTALPSITPSIRPTVSASPSSEPSNSPTETRSQNPSSEPTLNPSSNPSRSLYPTLLPSGFPTVSTNPTPTPSSKPTSSKPTSKPTSSKPTSNPTTNRPTSKPTSNPTRRPTLKPTTPPTARPTLKPTATARPTLKPTPTARPTLSPTIPPTFNPLPPPTPLQGPIQSRDLTVTLRGIDSIQSYSDWERATSTSFTEYYNDGSELVDAVVVVKISSIKENGFTRTRRLNGRELQSDPSIEIAYNQDLYYGSRDSSFFSEEQLARYPLSKDENRESYINSLKQLDGYDNLSGVSTIRDSTAPVVIPLNPPDKKNNVFAIVGGSFLAIIVIVAVGLVSFQKGKKYKDQVDNDDDEDVVAVEDAPSAMDGYDRSVLRSPGEQSEVTFDYDYTDIVSQGRSPHSVQEGDQSVQSGLTLDLDQSPYHNSGVSPIHTAQIEQIIYHDVDQDFLDTLYGRPVSATLVGVSPAERPTSTPRSSSVNVHAPSAVNVHDQSGARSVDQGEDLTDAIYSPRGMLDSVIETECEDPSLGAASSTVYSEDIDDREYYSRDYSEEGKLSYNTDDDEDVIDTKPDPMQVEDAPRILKSISSNGSSKASTKSSADTVIETAEKAILQAQEILEKLSED